MSQPRTNTGALYCIALSPSECLQFVRVCSSRSINTLLLV
jgi:hypothetical protein